MIKVIKTEAALLENYGRACALIWGQLSNAMRENVEANLNYEDTKMRLDVMSPINTIEGVYYKC